MSAALRRPFHRGPGGRWPGGWWILTEVEVQLDPDLCRPDVAGWRRERMPALPEHAPITIRPDWICEVLSPRNARADLVAKMRIYHSVGVPHYWIVDPTEELLTVYRWTPDGYLAALTAGREETVRAEPFDAVELRIGALLGDDEPES